MTLTLDHAIILVNDLQHAINHYRSVGFTTIFGGVHAGGKTHNALIVFADGTYLELLAPTSLALLETLDPNDRSSFLFLLAAGEGLGGYALLTDNIAAEVASMKQRGLDVSLKPSNGRARPDGQELRWHIATRDNGSMTPFFIQDETPRSLRVPDDPATTSHPNGTKGICELTIAVPNLMAAVNEHKQITGFDDFTVDGTTAHFHLPNTKLNLVLANSLVEARLWDIELSDLHGKPISLKNYL